MTSVDKLPYYLDKYGNMILRLAFSYLKNLQDAEDTTQEVFLKIVDYKRGFESPDHEKAWIIRVTINLCQNKLRRFWRRNVFSIDTVGDIPHNDSYNLDSTVLEAVMKLPENQRAAIHLFYYEEYSTAEIAEILGRKEATIRSDLHRARNRLKQLLKEEYDFE